MTSPTAAPPTRGRRLGRIGVVVAVVALLLFWAYVFFWPREARDKLDDRAWAEEAQAVCERWEAELDALPAPGSFVGVEPRAEALRQRADVGEQANTYLRSMVAELATIPGPAGAEDTELVRRWLQDWDAYLEARDAHVEEWRAGQDVRFKEPPVEAGKVAPISLRMDAFANTNLMVACRVPQDFG